MPNSAVANYSDTLTPQCLGRWRYLAAEGEIHLSPHSASRHGLRSSRPRYSEWLASILPVDRASVAAAIQMAVETGEPAFVQYAVEIDGVRSILAVALDSGDFDERETRIIQGVIVDRTVVVTERQSLLSELAALKEEYRLHLEAIRLLDESAACSQAIVESAIDGIITLNDHGIIETVNPATEKIFGFETVDLVGQNIKMVMPEPYHAEHDGYLKNYLETGDKKIIGIGRTVVGKRKNGSTFPIDLAVTEVKFGGKTLFAGTIRDVTERQTAEAEIRKLNEELELRVARRTEELTTTNAELDAFAYSVSHDLRAPLRHIGGFIELLEMELGDSIGERAKHYVETIIDSSTKMGTLIDDLLDFSRMARTDLTRREVNCNDIVTRVIEQVLPDALGRDITWHVDDLPDIYADESLLSMVWTNLIQNALKFTKDRTPAVIEIGCLESSTPERTYFIRDNGVGFDPRYADKLFGVFQRLHSDEEFEGTGIGLANVRRIVQRHGGSVRAEASLGCGASFYVTLPVVTL